MKLGELNVYNLSMELGEKVWKVISDWDNFSKETLGMQLIRSVDSVAANISEGFGRYHYKESNHFNYYARGSLYETKTWITKTYSRELITKELYNDLDSHIKDLGIRLNNYISSATKSSNQVKEKIIEYE
ncbi:MAG: four helix bundle protein [Bacteroidetes bacterium]|nr:four helix bundle protein [Bacteroidota bacterium]